MKAARLISDQLTADSTENTAGTSIRRRREFFGLSQEEFARLVGSSARSVANWERGRPMSAQVRQTMTTLADIQVRLVNLIRPDYIGRWLRIQVPALGGVSPLEAIERGQAERVYRLLMGLEEGLHA
jgi:transcriptional regulator with XRE-family HTH domain